MCQWEKNALRRKMECFWFSERGNQVPKDFSFMGSKRYCVNCILPAIPFASALCEWKQLPFIPRFLLRCLFSGYFILCRRLPKLLFSMKTLKWWIICLISYLGSFKIYFPNLHVLCLFPWFFSFPVLAVLQIFEK